MLKLGIVPVVAGLLVLSACGSTTGARQLASSSPPTTPVAAPSGEASPTPAKQNVVLVTYSNNLVTLVRPDGSVVATLPGYPVGDEVAIGAYVVMGTETGGAERSIDAAGVIRPVAPAAAALLTPATSVTPIIISSTSAVIGCVQTPAEHQANSACTAVEVNMATGAIRTLLTMPGTGNGQAAMAFGQSLQVLGVSDDLNTVWLRQVTGASSVSGQLPTAQVDVVGVDLRTGAVNSRALPKTLIFEQYLAISRDGKWVAGQEGAGTDSNNVVSQHLHVVSLATGVDSDVQGSAPYVSGGRPPEIRFAPDGATVAWWGSLNGAFNSGPGQRLNLSPTSGAGTTVMPASTNDETIAIGAFWVDGTTLLVQEGEGATFRLDTRTGSFEPLPKVVPYIEGLLFN